MTHLNIILDQEEILALLPVDYDGAFRKLLQECLNKVLLAESTEHLWIQRKGNESSCWYNHAHGSPSPEHPI